MKRKLVIAWGVLGNKNSVVLNHMSGIKYERHQ